MGPETVGKFHAHPKFHEMVGKRRRTIAALVALSMGAYVAFLLVLVLAPAVLARPLSDAPNLTIGLAVSFALIVWALVITGLYVRRANGEFDRLNTDILEDLDL